MIDSCKLIGRRLRFPALFVIVACLILAAPAVLRAAPKNKNAKSSPATASPKTAGPRNAISRDPYLGAIVVDAATGRVLFEDQPDAKGYPASVLKLMDLLIILEKIEGRQLALT